MAPGVVPLVAMLLRICWAVRDSESRAASNPAGSAVVGPVSPIVELEPPLAPVPGGVVRGGRELEAGGVRAKGNSA